MKHTEAEAVFLEVLEKMWLADFRSGISVWGDKGAAGEEELRICGSNSSERMYTEPYTRVRWGGVRAPPRVRSGA